MNWQLFLSETEALADSRLRLSSLSSLGSLLVLIIGAILVLTAIVTGQVWLFLLGAAQLLIIPFCQSARSSVAVDAQPAVERLRAGFLASLPYLQAMVGMTQRLAQTFWVATVRFLKSVTIGLSAGLLVLGWFAFQQPEMWRWGALRSEGPPLPALVVAIGITLLTILSSLWILKQTVRSRA